MSEAELDTLLDGVKSGSIETGPGKGESGDAASFDFENQYDVAVARLTRLDGIHQAFVESCTRTLSGLLGESPSLNLAYVHTSRFGEFAEGLSAPLSINVVKVMPQGKTALIVLDFPLLYLAVDQYFGGAGPVRKTASRKMLSPTELRMAHQLRQVVMDELQNAWQAVTDLSFAFDSTADHIDDAWVFPRDALVLEARFTVAFGDATGSLQIVMPYSLIETMRGALSAEASGGKEDEASAEWSSLFAANVNRSRVLITGSIGGLTLNLRDLVELSVGDVLPIEMPELVDINVEGVPVFRGMFGVSNGKHAVKISGTQRDQMDWD
ncbi:MAG: flagellar motor switch protein FliM [Pseudomonadota bacterium]